MKNIPPKLSPGDTIGIVCPSAGINNRAKHRIDRAVKYINSLGFPVKLGKHIFVNDKSYVAGSVDDRVDDIHNMFLDDSVKMILTGTGGNHANQLLRHLDYNLIKKHPKIFLGYSDITILHYALYTQANLVTYYGPCAATQFGEYPKMLSYSTNSFLDECVNGHAPSRVINPSDKWTEEFLDWFQKDDTRRARNMTMNTGYEALKPGNATAPIIPACIMAINRLAGTKYWIDLDNKVLLLDVLLSKGELDYPLLDAYLTDLYNIGVFDHLSGLIVSRPAGFAPQERHDLYERIKELTAHTSYPIIVNFDIGHTDPINTLRYDQTIQISMKNNVPILKTLD